MCHTIQKTSPVSSPFSQLLSVDHAKGNDVMVRILVTHIAQSFGNDMQGQGGGARTITEQTPLNCFWHSGFSTENKCDTWLINAEFVSLALTEYLAVQQVYIWRKSVDVGVIPANNWINRECYN